MKEKDAFEESDLPIKVDVVVWNNLSTDFQNLIKDDLQPIKDYENLKIIYIVNINLKSKFKCHLH